MNDRPLLSVENLVCEFTRRGWRSSVVRAVDGVDLAVHQGELLALVGESGSGKSTLGRSIIRLMKPTSGHIYFEGVDIARLRGRRLRSFRGDTQVIFQNPYQSLNPRMKVGATLEEVIAFWGRNDPEVRATKVSDLLESVHLPAAYARKYPHELSGGQRQRVAIARAMAVRPRLLVADEPVSALDVSSSATILNLLQELIQRTGLTCLFVTHDIGLARLVADRIAVMYRGSIVEIAAAEKIFTDPQDEYTRALIGAQLSATERHPWEDLDLEEWDEDAVAADGSAG
jgi:ABC-type oligopeptide transport system ATPase subunit